MKSLPPFNSFKVNAELYPFEIKFAVGVFGNGFHRTYNSALGGLCVGK